MNRRKLLVLFVILGLLTGLVGRVPVAKATDYPWVVPITPPLYCRVGSWSGGYLYEFTAGNQQLYMPAVTGFIPVVMSFGTGQFMTGFPTAEIRGDVPSGFHGVGYCVKWTTKPAPGTRVTVTVGPAYVTIGADSVYCPQAVYTFNMPANDLNWHTWASVQGYVPPTVTLAGPSAVDTVESNTWTATAQGGTTPYLYLWQWGTTPPYWSGSIAGTSTWSHVFSAGTWTLQVNVTDADGSGAVASMVIVAGQVVGAYQAHFTRTGPLGQYMQVSVTNVQGDSVALSGTSDTGFGIYATSGGAFGWVAADYEAVVVAGTSNTIWKITMSANFGGATSCPPADFWLRTHVHLANGVVLIEQHHWLSCLELPYTPWFGPTGNPLSPETPPTETSALPDWLQPVYDMFVRLLRYLFVPTSTDFSTQLAGGWVTITSPVPSITPQYTIPFPNPQHLLAPTGNSVDISFASIQSWTYYSTVKTIVQVVLDAILIFVVISIVT